MGIAWILASSIGLFRRSGIGNQAKHPYIQNGFPTRNLPKYLTKPSDSDANASENED